MDDVIISFLDKYEEKLRLDFLRICTERKALNGKLLENEDLRSFWHKIEPEYMADAVLQIADYPTVSVAWAFYLGMAVATYWDEDWKKGSAMSYKDFYGSDGFDNMDDHIVADILKMPLETQEAQQLITLIQSLAHEAISHIRHEQIEPQSKMAFYVFVRTCRVMYTLGAAIQLRRMGYTYEKL